VAAEAIEEAAAIERQRIGQHRSLDLLQLLAGERVAQWTAGVAKADEEADAVPSTPSTRRLI
jgi:hypothetical protein